AGLLRKKTLDAFAWPARGRLTDKVELELLDQLRLERIEGCGEASQPLLLVHATEERDSSQRIRIRALGDPCVFASRVELREVGNHDCAFRELPALVPHHIHTV